MFATKSGFEAPKFMGIVDPARSYWQVVELSTFVPWFLLTYRMSIGDGDSLLQTVAVACEQTLTTVIEELGSAPICGLCLVRPTASNQNWTVQHVQVLWLPAPSEQQRSGPMLFSFNGDPLVYDSHYEVVDTHCQGRRKLLSLGASV